MVRPARFELATYGFVERSPSFRTSSMYGSLLKSLIMLIPHFCRFSMFLPPLESFSHTESHTTLTRKVPSHGHFFALKFSFIFNFLTPRHPQNHPAHKKCLFSAGRSKIQNSILYDHSNDAIQPGFALENSV